MECDTCKGDGGSSELHSCPFGAEIYNEMEDSCNCCEACEQECADSV